MSIYNERKIYELNRNEMKKKKNSSKPLIAFATIANSQVFYFMVDEL